MFVSLFFIIISISSDQKAKKYIYKGDKAIYLHTTVSGVQHFVSKPLHSIWSPGSNTDSQVC